MAFAGHFHVHDEFSPLDGTGNRNQLTREAVKKGQTHLGCTNHGRLGSALDHVHACRHPEDHDDPDDPSRKRSKDERLIPILGIEAFWRPDRFMDLSDPKLYGKNGHNWAQHLCLHAGSLAGWRTLMRLSSKSWVPREKGGGYYGKPVMDMAMLDDDHEGIIISTACLASPLSQLILAGDESGARQWVIDMCEIVGDENVWLEIMPHDLDMQRTVNLGKIEIANELGLGYIVTGDVHMPYKEWVDTQSIVRMASYGTSVAQQTKKKDAGEEIYTEEIDTIFLSSEEELLEMFEEYHPDIPEDVVQEALDNTVEFARRFRGYVIGKTPKMPKVTKNDREAQKILKGWIEQGFVRLRKRWKNAGVSPLKMKALEKRYRERAEYEFGVLKSKRVIDYFILVGDFVRWAKSTDPLPPTKDDPEPQRKRPIRVGLGRGSAAGCLVSYLIGITAIDPIAWGLLFERFLNPDRQGLPDIDIDFETEVTVLEVPVRGANGKIEMVAFDGRDLVKEYIKRKYGYDHVADIIAYQTFAPKAVIKAVLLTQDWNPGRIKKITDTIGDTDRELEKLAADVVKDGETVKGNEALQKLRDDHPELWTHMLRLEDQILRDSRHAGGVVITNKPVSYYMPTQLGNDEKSVVTAWADRADFPIVSDYGFLKNDILGVKSLTKQEIAVQLIRDHYGEDFEPNDLPVLTDPFAADQKVIDGFVHGWTVDVFQFASRGITQLLRHIKPDNAMDIAVANALFRPGPISIAFEYGDRKNGKTPITYWHDSLEPILGETLGLMCFQEQAMEVVKQLAGFSGGDADNFRKIMSKLYRLPGDKAQQVMQKDHDRFIEGCVKNGVEEEAAESIWTDRMLPLGNYLFNKSHAGSYGLQAYQDMHIKIFYPLAFYAAGLTVTKKQKKEEQIDYLKRVMRESSIFDVYVKPPDVNTSGRAWTIASTGKLRRGDGGDIRYGLVSISGLGGAAAQDVIKARPFRSWGDYLKKMPSGFGTNTHEALAKAGALDELIDRSYVLARTRQWGSEIEKLKILMSCKCKKTKTVKLNTKMLDRVHEEFDGTDDADRETLMEMAIQLTLEDDVKCKNHPKATVEEWEKIDPHYSVLAYEKEHDGESPEEYIEPTQADLLAMEVETLNIPLSLRNILVRYEEFIEERIWTEEEFEELPAKPPKAGKKHGTYCQCEGCEAAKCVIGGEITMVKKIETKRTKETMAFVDVEHGGNKWSVTLFPFAYKRYGHLLKEPTAFLFAGHKDDRGQLIAYDVKDVFEVAAAEGWEPDVRGGDVIQMGGGVKGLVIASKKKIKVRSKAA